MREMNKPNNSINPLLHASSRNKTKNVTRRPETKQNNVSLGLSWHGRWLTNESMLNTVLRRLFCASVFVLGLRPRKPPRICSTYVPCVTAWHCHKVNRQARQLPCAIITNMIAVPARGHAKEGPGGSAIHHPHNRTNTVTPRHDRHIPNGQSPKVLSSNVQRAST